MAENSTVRYKAEATYPSGPIWAIYLGEATSHITGKKWIPILFGEQEICEMIAELLNVEQFQFDLVADDKSGNAPGS